MVRQVRAATGPWARGKQARQRTGLWRLCQLAGRAPRFTRLQLPALLLALLLSLPATALAAKEDVLGFGPRATALGGAFAAVADDFSAVYYNPAGLALHPRTGKGFEVEVGFVYGSPNLWTRDPGGAKTPAETLSIMGIDLGMVLNFAALGATDRIVFGLGLHLPMSKFFYWRSRHSNERQFILYEDRAHYLSFLPALSVRISDWMSAGVGLRFTVSVNTQIFIEFEPKPEDLAMLRGEFIRITPVLSPYFGLLFKPAKRLRLALVYKEQIYADDYGSTYARLVGTIRYDHHLAHYFSPRQLTIAGSYDFGPVRASLDFIWQHWSPFLDSNHDAPEPGFRDTVQLRLGMEVRLPKDLRLRLGYAFEPTPAPDQTERMNLLDNDKHILSLGWEMDFRSLIGKKFPHIKLSLFFQMQFLVTRTTAKLDPAQTPFDSGGYLLSGGFSLSFTY